MSEPRARDPRADATSLLPDGYEARILEPSPPASNDPAWYADDSTDPSGADGKIVTPIIGTLAVVATRRQSELRLVALGSTILVLGLMGLRALH